MDRTTRPDAKAVDASPQEGPASALSRAALKPRVGVALGLAAAVTAYHELLWYAPEKNLAEELEQLFFMPSQSVAPLVVLLSAWLLYRRAGRLRSLPPARAPWLGWSCLAAGGLLHGWATLASAPDLLVPSLGLVGFGAAALWKGRAAVRAVLLPVLFLLFAMPLPAPLLNEVIFRLQIATADLTGVLLSLLQIPHHVAGEQILRTSQTFSVIETCSGLRSIETLAMVAILMADLFGRTRFHAILLVAAAPPLAFFLNGWRAVALILNPHSELVAVHNLQGVVILLGGLVLLFLLDGVLDNLAPGLGAQRAPVARREGGTPADLRTGALRGLAGAVAMLAVLALGSLALPRFDTSPPDGLQLSSRLAAGIGDLFSQEVPTDRVLLGSAGFRDSVTRRFQRGGHGIDVFLGVGWRPGRARSPISPKTALPGSGWILESEQARVLAPDGRRVRQLLFRSDTHTLLAYHWYEGSMGLAAEALRVLAALDAGSFRRPGEIIAVRITTDVEGPIASGLAPAASRLDAFYAELRSVLDRLEREPSLAHGKPFPHFPSRANFFHETEFGPFREVLVNQDLEAGKSLGMVLANQSGEVATIRVDPSRETGVRPPPEPGASGSSERDSLDFDSEERVRGSLTASRSG